MRLRFFILLLAAIALAGCTDLAGFQGDWRGRPEDDPALREGIGSGTPVALYVEGVDRVALRGTLTVGNEVVRLRPVVRAANDMLGSLDLPDAPLRSYLLVGPLAEGDALCVVSLYPDPRVDLRILRSDALYVVAHLGR
ncbi:MAG: hypothetical protein EXR72_22205 [Myxococcales bacterium]|nr:hypothetical protein [Myxococcales bacterium]